MKGCFSGFGLRSFFLRILNLNYFQFINFITNLNRLYIDLYKLVFYMILQFKTWTMIHADCNNRACEVLIYFLFNHIKDKIIYLWSCIGTRIHVSSD